MMTQTGTHTEDVYADNQHPKHDAELFHYVLDIPKGYINDHCLIFDGSQWHLFFIQGTIGVNGQSWYRAGNEIHIGHAVSSDLLNWNVHVPALTVQDGHPLRGGHIYAPYVISWKNSYYMFYAGNSAHTPAWSERNPNTGARSFGERIFLATSKDLWDWQLHPCDPLFVPNPSYAYYTPEGPFGCRDPHVLPHATYGFLMYYVCQPTDQIDESGNAVINSIAVASSFDLIHWTDLGPVMKRRGSCFECYSYARPESPCVIERDGLWYLFWKGGNGTRYIISDDPLDFHNREAYFLATSHASEIIEWNDRWYLTSCSRPVEDIAHLQDRSKGLYLARIIWDGIWPKLARFTN